MSRPGRRARAKSNPPARKRRVPALWIALACVAAGAAALAVMSSRRKEPSAVAAYAPRPKGTITFNREIAPIVLSRCAGCHRPSQAGPFPLLGYQDVTKRASQIAKVTASRYMPPWPPEPGHGKFVDERRLTETELGLLQQWIAEGAPEGRAADLPPLPKWDDDWQLGTPDLVVKMPRPYALAAEGRDVYRNFVMSVPLSQGRFVRAVELRPGNRRILHHAFLKVDTTRQSRALEAREKEPGFPGMNAPAEMPGGHFLTWQPGKVATALPEGLAFRLEPGNDIVLQAHLNPSGKPESFEATVGLYFTDRPPTNSCFKMMLTTFVIDISPGETNYVVEDRFTMPADAHALAVLPHAHYLARQMEGWATRPDGSREWLLRIADWDFNWQGDYRYATPVFLPRGTTLHMRYTYDNSAGNPRNPHQPPQRVRFGAESRDEMAELWLQLLPRDAAARAAIAEAQNAKMDKVFIAADEFRLRLNPNDTETHVGYAKSLAGNRRFAEAIEHLQTAMRLRPDWDEPHYVLGIVFRRQNKLQEAEQAFLSALGLNPNNQRAHGNLGFIYMDRGQLREAEVSLREALRLNPDDTLVQQSLADVLKATNRRE